MTKVAPYRRLLLTNFHTTNHSCRDSKTTITFPSTKFSFPLFTSKPLHTSIFKHKEILLLHSLHPSNSPHKPLKPFSFFFFLFSPESILLFAYFTIFLSLRLLSSLLPPNFPQQWHRFIVSSSEADARSSNFPPHLWKVVVAYEDRRFYKHCGIDPIGIARALLLFPGGGGGSTITQQLVKNTFLKSERSFSRKAVEMVLALILERTMTKRKIINSYLSKELRDSRKQGGRNSTVTDIWDWERESKIWEVRENMERWARRIQKSFVAVNSFIKST